MANWKLGTGTSYAGLTGFTWPTNFNPAVEDRQIQKLNMVRPMPYSDYPLLIDQGTQAIPTAITGVLYSQSDFDNLIAQAAKSVVGADGRVTNFMQRLYHSATEYYLVRNGSVKKNRFATNPLGFAYVANFNGADPFIYTDGVTTYQSGSGASPRTASSIANTGNAYVFPTFEIVNAGGTAITALTISYGAVDLTWEGSLAASTTLTIYQDILESNGLYGLHAYISGAESGLVGGSRIILAENVSGKSMSCAFTGGSGGANFKVLVQNRRWG